jgi:hypothetical protein
MDTSLEKLISLCKGGVYLNINEHKDEYLSAEDWMNNDNASFANNHPDLAIYREMINKDTIICLQAYPNTPIGSYTVYHYDLASAISLMINIIRYHRNHIHGE